MMWTEMLHFMYLYNGMSQLMLCLSQQIELTLVPHIVCLLFNFTKIPTIFMCCADFFFPKLNPQMINESIQSGLTQQPTHLTNTPTAVPGSP